ncbi:hypothetical protein FHX52_4180 [Humibacillus xanthopallidus]|uniref:Superfamily IV 4 TMS phage holin n=1 Tax=Humibacillus xanthopallidus TaxID=412689 RepID=A0A543PLK3_9MICO|nr:hypothetical protein [Humibacillus xanthopallidus]TQN44956.1 hypothetical protein FHX52_4180 [Humibacillus xanthopallidus]
MIRFLVRTAIFLGSAAIGLIAADLILDDVSVTASGFLLTVVIYTVVQSVISPFLAKVAASSARALLGGVGLIATFLALLAASIFANSLTITGGAATWVLATLIVWLVTAVVTLLLPIALVKAGVESARERRAA